MLSYQLTVPTHPVPDGPVAVLLHGRGSDEYDLAGLRDELPVRAIVTPRAPFPGAPWGYGPGHAWYRFMGGRAPEPATLHTSLEQLDEFLGQLPKLLPFEPGPVILGGFSQGGTVALAYALTRPGAIRLVVNLSGFLPDHPDVIATPESVRGTAIFWGHGRLDGSIPFAWAEAGWATLREAGADLTAHAYAAAHTITGAELHDLGAWIEARGSAFRQG